MHFRTRVKHSDCEADHMQLVLGLRVRGAVPAVLRLIFLAWFYITHRNIFTCVTRTYYS